MLLLALHEIILGGESFVSDETLDPVEIAPGTYWVGKRDPHSIFHANPYLRVFYGASPGQQRSVQFNLLIDPGSSSDFSVVSTKVGSLIGGMDRLSGVFLNHQDPDVVSSTPLITGRFAPRAAIITSQETWRLVVHMNLPKDRFVAPDRLRTARLPSGHRLIPVPTPFCHFRGAVALYDPETRVLFSGDLLGGLTDENTEGLWAQESDWKGVRAFHQIYMPANAAIARAIATIQKLDPPVEIIAPQHGRLLKGEVMQRFLDRLARLPVGVDILEEVEDPTVIQAWERVLQRVMEVARAYLGAMADSRLADSGDLADTLSFSGSEIKIRSAGRWSLERAVEILRHGEPAVISNQIAMEAVVAAAEYGLPTPKVTLTEGEGENAALLAS